MDHKNDNYIPELRYRWLTRFYDPIVAIMSREKVFKKEVAGIGHKHPCPSQIPQ